MRTSTIIPAILIAGPALPALAAPVFGYRTPAGQAEHVHPQSNEDYVAHNQAHVHHLAEATSKTSGMRAHAGSSRPWSPGTQRQFHASRSYPEEYPIRPHGQTAAQRHAEALRLAEPPSPSRQAYAKSHNMAHHAAEHYARAEAGDEVPPHHQSARVGAQAAQRPHRGPGMQHPTQAYVHVPGQTSPEHESHATHYARPAQEHEPMHHSAHGAAEHYARAVGDNELPAHHRFTHLGATHPAQRPHQQHTAQHAPEANVHVPGQTAPELERHVPLHVHPEYEHAARALGQEESPADHRFKHVGTRVGMNPMQRRPSLQFGHGPVVNAHIPEAAAAEHRPQAMHHAHPAEMEHPPRELGADEMPAQHRLGRMGTRVGIPEMAAQRRPSSHFGQSAVAEPHVPAHAAPEHESHASHHSRPSTMGHVARAMGAEEPAAHRVPLRFGLAVPSHREPSFERGPSTHHATEHSTFEPEPQLHAREYESLVARKNKKAAAKPKPKPKPAPKPSTQSTTQHRWNEANQDIKNVGNTVSAAGKTVSTIAKVGHGIWDAVESFLKREDIMMELEAREFEDWLTERGYEVDELD